ncbi:MAG: aminotransferase class V-fold PLP-dependent enzyme [Candidatus Marinimicrobia bacterium]|nr:aminotransferase class V-fold PLP-dependent enzyme [Candidatus Neomarinimicrobiota bacterium]
MIDAQWIAARRAEFPFFTDSGQPPPAYLDNAATTLRPRVVATALARACTDLTGNVHRATHHWSEETTMAYEAARAAVARWLGAAEPAEVLFTRNATESLNWVATGWGQARGQPGARVLVTAQEHHSNLLPWRAALQRCGGACLVAGVQPDGRVDPDQWHAALAQQPQVVAFPLVSNVTGIVNPVAEWARAARAAGALVVLDAAQGLIHHPPLALAASDFDFVVGSGHKLFGPPGIGFLWARRAHLNWLPPPLLGGEMVATVTATTAQWSEPPWRFEAGTPNIIGALGFAAALDYLRGLDRDQRTNHLRALTQYAQTALAAEPGVRLVGARPESAGILAFTVEGIHPHDVAQFADAENVAIRAGRLCAQPYIEALGHESLCRASFQVYNDESDIQRLLVGIRRARAFFLAEHKP